MKFCLPEELKLVSLLAPAADAAGRTGAYVTLKNCFRAYIVVHMTQGNAATVALTINQASAVAGTGAKVITNTVRIWSNLDMAASDALVSRTAAVNYTTDAGVKLKMVVFEIEPVALDLDNGFDCITVATGASNAANITAAWVLLDCNYEGATPPTAVVD